MLTTSDLALSRFEQMRAAANDDRPKLISATVTVRMENTLHSFPAVGFSIKAIEESAEELAGDDPFGVSVMVHQ